MLKENDFLKNKIILISKELECIFLENIFLKNNFASHSCHAPIDSSSHDKNNVSLGCSTSSFIDNDICILKKSVDCLGSTLSQCAMDHKRLESMFRKKHALPMHAHYSRHTHASHAHTRDTMYASCLLYTSPSPRDS